ncbi:MAG: undecaprenyl/decaprenyl-phosphate alpha-N-acetylglucosaminyl 1-phosphate transferase [Planctomycetes bacterium]|nr:undecaprenyl/decaprenyl-phosphate alpha-N-acetylglucosaminyl 1-phosphate transferase [Planctomycetota bacterium]
MIGWAFLALCGAALAISAAATAVSMPVAARLGFLDRPGGHKAHARPVPVLGGSAIFIAILLPCLAGLVLANLWNANPPEWLPQEIRIHIPGFASRTAGAIFMLAGAMVLHVMGLIDDRKNLGPWIKLLIQIAVCIAVVLLCDVRVLTMAGPAASVALTTLWLVVITNSFNLLDNMDGLSAGVAAICAAALLAAAMGMGQWFVSAMLCLILGAALGFLPFNFAPARTYMGDAGSLVLGFLLAVASCQTTYVLPGGPAGLYAALTPLLVMAVPLYDTCSVIIIRLRQHRSPMVGDRRHFSHRLQGRGMSVRKTVLTIYLCTAATAVSASLLPHLAGPAGAAMAAGQVLAILAVIALMESAGPKDEKPDDSRGPHP